MENDDAIVPIIQDAEIKKIISDDRALERFLTVQVNLNADGVFFESSCPICNSTSRRQAEEQWLADRDAKKVRDLFKQREETYPITVIKNHMEYHIDQSYVELRKREYINKVVALSKINLDTMSRLELALSSISERILSVNSAEDPSISAASLEKSRADATCKLVASMTKLLELRATLMGEGVSKGDLLTVSNKDFESIFQDILREYQTPIAREIVGKILDKFMKVSRKK